MEAVANKPKRVAWVDMARGTAMILTIIGHTAAYDSILRNLIFSFHMPLFFFLSGYTFHQAENWDELKKHTRKDAIHLLIPALAVSVITMLIAFLLSADHSSAAFGTAVIDLLNKLFWSSGVQRWSIPGLGMMWFLVSLFGARLIINLLGLVFKGEKVHYLYFGLGLLGMELGKNIWLPFDMDVTFVSLMFMSFGILFHAHEDQIKKLQMPLFLFSCFFWTYCLSNNEFIEMSMRTYPHLFSCVLEAFCGIFICYSIITVLADCSWIRRILAFIGTNTMLILYIHSIEDSILSAYWYVMPVGKAIVLRFGLIAVCFLVLWSIQKTLKSKKQTA